MTLNISKLELALSQKINTSASNIEILAASRALEKLKNGLVSTVATLADLPSPTISIGQLYFVEADGLLYYCSDALFGFTPITTTSITTLWTWGGETGNGQLGTGDSTARSSPVTTAGGGTNWSKISIGVEHSIAVKTDGTLWTWGHGGSGRLGSNTTASRSSPGTTAGGGTNWRAADAGACHSIAVKTDGTLWTWGWDGYGLLGTNYAGSTVSPVTTAGGGTNWCLASAGFGHSIAVKTDGTLWTWGKGSFGRLGGGTISNRSSPGTTAGGGTNWCAIAAGCLHSLALKTDGTLWTWGCAVGGGAGTSTTSPVTTAGGGTNWKSINSDKTGGIPFISAIKTDGTLWTWGSNNCGQLGDGTTTYRSSPVTTAGGGTNWCQSSSSYRNTAAIKTDGTLWTWGACYCGVFGSRSSPGSLNIGNNNWCSVSMGKRYLHALLSKTL